MEVNNNREIRRSVLIRNLYYSSLLIILVYVTMLNTFAYHAYWEERISQGFGQVDGLESKVVHGLLISSTDYREWGLSLFDATIQFLTSWQGLTFYAIVLVILLLQLTPLLAMRSKYFVPVTILLDSCCWAGYISLLARKAIQHPCDGVYPTIYIVSSAVLLMLGFRFLQYRTLQTPCTSTRRDGA